MKTTRKWQTAPRSMHFSFCIICLQCSSAMNGFAQAPGSTTAVPATPPSLSTNNGDFWTQDELTGDWGGYREWLKDHGVSMGLDWVTQGFENFRGGLNTGTAVASTADLSITFDTEKMGGWQGGEFHVDLEDHAGPDPSQDLVGDVQKFTNLNYTPFLQVAELWVQQTAFNNTLRIKLGKVDANTEFSVIDNGLPFLNSSAQDSPTIIMFPTFPDDMPGANVFFTPNDTFYASFGAYYATRGDRFLDITGAPQAAQLTEDAMFFIGETGLKWKRLCSLQEDGNIRLGFWGDTGTFPSLGGGRKEGTHGIYAIADQTLWKPTPQEDETRGLRLFMEYAQSPGDVSIVDRHIGGGLTWTGFFAGRPKDIMGISPQYVHLSDGAALPKSYELAVEGFYQYQITGWASIQPDLQYIRHPAGQYPDALVGTLQLEVHF